MTSGIYYGGGVKFFCFLAVVRGKTWDEMIQVWCMYVPLGDI